MKSTQGPGAEPLEQISQTTATLQTPEQQHRGGDFCGALGRKYLANAGPEQIPAQNNCLIQSNLAQVNY